MQYLITDIRTLTQTWVSASSVRAALVAHENTWRSRKLPDATKISDYSKGAAIDASLGESACCGLVENVVKGGF